MTKTLLSSFVVFSIASSAQDAGVLPAQAPVAAAAVQAAEPTAADVTKGLDQFWLTRDSGESVKSADALLRTGTKLYPNDYEVLWRAARAMWWVADGADEKAKKQYAKEGWNFAQRAVAVKEGSEAKYYLAINIGAYSQAVGILKALGDGLEGKFNENLDFAIKADASFDFSGPLLSKGRYYYELPWPKRDLKKSKEHYEKVLAKEPKNVRAHYFFAETLLKDGDAKAAKEQIDQVFSIPESHNPPEAKRIRRWAKPVKEAIEKELQ
jgi:tetratricopeptide (TPR) repeat protein